jgi:hypothetical protein
MTAPLISAGMPRLAPAPLELVAAGLELVVVAAVGEAVPIVGGKLRLKLSPGISST